VTLVNGATDTVTANNIEADTLQAALSSKPLPLVEGFSGSFPPAGWTVETAGDYYSGFDIDNETGSDELGSITAFNTIFVFENFGWQGAIMTPSLDLTTIAQPTLSFDRAFNFHRYTPPYVTDTIDFADTLEVLISTDCGDTWQELFRKGGAELATFAEPIINPLNINQDFITPEEADWKRESIDLSNFASAKNAVIKFSYISGLGGHIYIDNIRVQGPAAVSQEASAVTASVYPNPATDRLMINGLSSNAQIRVLDVMGREVVGTTSASPQLTLDVSSLAAGNYVLQIISDGETQFEKFSIQR
jgi:hypothetical protein